MASRTSTTQKELQSALQEEVTRMSDDEEHRKRYETILEQNGYTVQETIGTGAFSSVKKAFSKTMKQTVAIKIISKQKANVEVLNKFIPREIQLIRNLRHENLIRFYECIETTYRFYIIMQYAENGSLLELIRKEKFIPEERAKSYFNQLINAVEYIHSMGVVHRDIKCENIVFDSNYTLKLIDFGFARGNMLPVLFGGKIMPVLSKTFCGSHAYASPEILKSLPYQPQLSDIWAVGVVLYTMVVGRLPFTNDTNINHLLKLVLAGPKYPEHHHITDECKSLIQKILRPVKNRISIKEMRRQPWLGGLDAEYDNTDIEKHYQKRIKLDDSCGESSDGGNRLTMPSNATSGSRDDNDNTNSNGRNCTTMEVVQNGKRKGKEG